MYFMEGKLKLIDKFMHVMDRNTLLILLEKLNKLNEPEDMSLDFSFFNTHPSLVRVLIFRMT